MDGLGRLERMLAEWEREKAGHPLVDNPKHRYIFTADEEMARFELNKALLNAAPELIQVAQAADRSRIEHSSYRYGPGGTCPCDICTTLAALARKLDGQTT